MVLVAEQGLWPVGNYNRCLLYGSTWKMCSHLNFEAIRYDREAGRLSASPDRPLDIKHGCNSEQAPALGTDN